MTRLGDIVAYLIDQDGELPALKLHALLFQAQLCHLGMYKTLLFDEAFEARKVGPILPTLYAMHQGLFLVGKDWCPPGNPKRLGPAAIGVVDTVLYYFGAHTTQELLRLCRDDGLFQLLRHNQPESACPVMVPQDLIVAPLDTE